MPLRNPRYLNRADFYDHADYGGIDIPRRTEVIARTSTSRTAAAKLGLHSIGIPVGAEGSLGDTVELQSAYTLETGEKTSFSKVLDAMEADSDALTVLPLDAAGEERWAGTKDQLVELSGSMTLSPVSSVGKIFNVLLQMLGHKDFDLSDLESLATEAADDAVEDQEEVDGIPSQAQQILKNVFLRNEIPKIPTLFELDLDDADAPWQVFVSCAPEHFIGVGAAATDSIEGDVAVVGVVSEFVGEDPHDGFIGTERWLLHGWERTMRVMMRPQLDDLTESLIPVFDPTWKHGEASYYIKGPAVIIEAVAIF